jgi:hypothetical protein
VFWRSSLSKRFTFDDDLMGVVSQAIHIGIGHDLVRKDAGLERGV